MEHMIKLVSAEIWNVKNVKHGKVDFCNKGSEYDGEGDILGIYGADGSGKSAIIDSIAILQVVLSGLRLGDDLKNIIMSGEDESSFEFVFLHISNNNEYLVTYNFKLKRYDNKYGVRVVDEKLQFSENHDGEIRNPEIIIDLLDIDSSNIYSGVQSSKKSFKERELLSEILDNNSHASFLHVSRIFYFRNINIRNEVMFNNDIRSDIINALNEFGKCGLRVIGDNSIKYTEPILHMENYNNEINMFGLSRIDDCTYTKLNKDIHMLNDILKTVVPGLMLGISVLDEEESTDGSILREVEINSIRKDVSAVIPLRYESKGIKKIVSMLEGLTVTYNNPNGCLVVDDVDIHEFLAGELFTILESNIKGQLIYTANSLRGLEVVDRSNIMFTTTNSEDKYIRLSNTLKDTNFRETYLREIVLGEQGDLIFPKIESYKIRKAFGENY